MNIVMIGAGLASVRAAEELRAQGFSGSITIVGAERHAPYERPPLSKDFLSGDVTIGSIALQPESFFREQRIDLRLGRAATRVDRKARRVEIGDEALPYDRLLLATGSTPRRLKVEGASLEGVAVLRNADDAVWLSRRLATVQRVVVIGAGAIGLELASAARVSGKSVTVVDVAPRPLSRILSGHPLADRIAELHAARGVDLRLGLGVRRLLGDRSVEAVELADGRRLEAQLVLVSIGVRPNVELAGEAGLLLDDGIVVDGALRTSDPYIFAAGDVARTWIPRYRRLLRFEQYGVAQQQGRHAARAMLGEETPFAVLPGFGTTAYGVRIQFAGLLQGDEDVRVSEANAGFMAYFVKQRRLQGLLALNQPKAMLAARPLLESNEVGALDGLGVRPWRPGSSA